MVRVGVIGALGYVIVLVTVLISSFITLPFELSPVVSIVAVIGAIMLGVAWYFLGRGLKDRLMELFGVLIVGMTLLTVALVVGIAIWFVTWGVGFAVIIPIYVVPAIILTLLIMYAVESGVMRNIVILLLILTIVGFVGMVFIGLLAWLLLAGFIGLYISVIALHVRGLLAAGTKLESRCFRFSGWFMLGSVLLMIVCIGLLVYLYGAIGAMGVFGFGGAAPRVLLVAEITKWVAYAQLALYAVAVVLATIAFLGVRKVSES